MPVMIGPTGLAGLVWPHGECEAAKAAHSMGTNYCLSHGSVCTMEELSDVEGEANWMQIFIYKDRGLTREFCSRAYAAGFEALVLTIDNQIPGKRERDLQNGFTIPPNFSLLSYFRLISKYKFKPHLFSLYHIFFIHKTKYPLVGVFIFCLSILS